MQISLCWKIIILGKNKVEWTRKADIRQLYSDLLQASKKEPNFELTAWWFTKGKQAKTFIKNPEHLCYTKTQNFIWTVSSRQKHDTKTSRFSTAPPSNSSTRLMRKTQLAACVCGSTARFNSIRTVLAALFCVSADRVPACSAAAAAAPGTQIDVGDTPTRGHAWEAN